MESGKRAVKNAAKRTPSVISGTLVLLHVLIQRSYNIISYYMHSNSTHHMSIVCVICLCLDSAFIFDGCDGALTWTSRIIHGVCLCSGSQVFINLIHLY